tara:strand:- start:1797 stop:3071 length:1275 start_codon:yes stop_codon:yes gene_type:complete
MGNSKHTVVIIGGGTAGITVASQLLKKKSGLDIAIIEPSEKHYYQPAWTLVGAGTYDFKDTERSEASVMPDGVTWIKEFAEEFDPKNNKITTKAGSVIEYEYLIVAPGIKIDLSLVEGLEQAMETDSVCSTYIDPNKVWKTLQNFKGGTALFTQPATPIKCGGAPQKIMYLADDAFRKQGVRDKTDIVFATPGSVIFGVPEFADTLMQVVNRKRIILKFFHKLVKVDGEKKIAYYEITAVDDSQCVTVNDDTNKFRGDIVGTTTIAYHYDLLHLAPPQAAPDFIQKSVLAHQEGPSKGWLNVDINTLQSPDYPNVFGLGDAAALPTAKTGAAVRKQAPVVTENILALMEGKTQLGGSYEGYSSCPLVTGYGKMVLAEFGYKNKRMSDPLISKFVDTTKENWSMWILKKYGLPFMYWNLMLKGKA